MITFNNIPTTVRTPGAYVEIDNSRALKGLVANPHKALILGQKIAAGTQPTETLIAISRDNLADGYFGAGSELARMCNVFKDNNPNTELYAIAISHAGATALAEGTLQTSVALSVVGSCSGAGTLYLMLNGKAINVALASGWQVADVNSAIVTDVNADSTLPVTASTNATSAVLFIAVNSGINGNYIDFRYNYYDWQSLPCGMTDSMTITAMTGGSGNTDISPAWAIIDAEQFHYIIQPNTDATSLTSIESELTDRFGPLIDLQGHGFTGYRGALASCTAIGNSRNNAHNTIMGFIDSPTPPEEWAAALGAIAAYYLNIDPARPLSGLKLKNVLPPPVSSRFTRAERDIILYDGIATFTVDTGGNTLIERCITTYQTNAQGISDPSYLDIQTLATLNEIRYQFKTRMTNRFISPRFKLADDTFPVQPGSYVATPIIVKQEIIALFSLLRDKGYIENLDDFKDNLVVERDATDVNRVNVLCPPDLINQFRVLAGLIQFIL